MPRSVRATHSNGKLGPSTSTAQNTGVDLTDDAAVGPRNLFLHSMFSQVDVSLNGTLITPSTNTYPYRAMIETLLSYGEDAKKSQLSSALFYKDVAGKWMLRL